MLVLANKRYNNETFTEQILAELDKLQKINESQQSFDNIGFLRV